MMRPDNILRRLGARSIDAVWRLGFATRFLFAILRHTPSALRRFRLTVREIYFAGVMSLTIILVSGLFVGMVLGLQGYDTLARYGSS
jgi:phospholipid/cholesterol/gamma-HCH transport system permease protein